MPNLSSDEIALLQWVRDADEDAGGLWEEEVDDGQRAALLTLVEGGFVERVGSAGGFEEHGDEDVDDGGVYRMTARGVEALRSIGPR